MESRHVESFSIRSGTTADQSTDSKSARPLVDETEAQQIQASTRLTSQSHSNQESSQSSVSWLNWRKILEAVSLSCVILVAWGLFALPIIFYALPSLQVRYISETCTIYYNS